jgi:hypothetical protein
VLRDLLVTSAAISITAVVAAVVHRDQVVRQDHREIQAQQDLVDLQAVLERQDQMVLQDLLDHRVML